jgi:histidinol-phosphate aminotransferase
MNLNKLLRKNIKNLVPYSSARDEFTGDAKVFLDANENPFNAPYNRYPDPLQKLLKRKISDIKGVSREQIFLGNGSDEPIDLMIRAFCEPETDNIVTIDPTYGMYQIAAKINNVAIRKVSLSPGFSLDPMKVLHAVDLHTKLIFLCSPNNPSGNNLSRSAMLHIVRNFKGIVIVDEAYIDFSPENSLLPDLETHQNLVVLQTLSKAWGMAGIRLGMAFASPEIVAVLNKIKYPYNLNMLTQQKAIELLENKTEVESWVSTLISERKRVSEEIEKLEIVQKVYPSDANFVLVAVDDASGIYKQLVKNGIIVRDRSKVNLCAGCLRITIGSPDENNQLLTALKNLKEL